jgi:hypothetical protein
MSYMFKINPLYFHHKSQEFFAFSLNLICPYIPYMVQKHLQFNQNLYVSYVCEVIEIRYKCQ